MSKENSEEEIAPILTAKQKAMIEIDEAISKETNTVQNKILRESISTFLQNYFLEFLMSLSSLYIVSNISEKSSERAYSPSFALQLIGLGYNIFIGIYYFSAYSFSNPSTVAQVGKGIRMSAYVFNIYSYVSFAITLFLFQNATRIYQEAITIDDAVDQNIDFAYKTLTILINIYLILKFTNFLSFMKIFDMISTTSKVGVSIVILSAVVFMNTYQKQLSCRNISFRQCFKSGQIDKNWIQSQMKTVDIGLECVAEYEDDDKDLLHSLLEF